MRHSLKKREQTQGESHCTCEEPDGIAAHVATLPWTDGLACLLCTPSHEVESAIDDMTVEPSDRLREETEHNLVASSI